MSRYKVEVQALPAQTFSARLGGNTLTLELQWMPRFEVFRVNVLSAAGATLTAGRFLVPGSNLLANLYPTSEITYGSLKLEGDPATPDNLGVSNTLVWSDE